MVGVAHNVSFTRPYGLFDVAAVTLANSLTLFPYVDSICDKLDFIGINYYGQVLLFSHLTFYFILIFPVNKTMYYSSHVNLLTLFFYWPGSDIWFWTEASRD